MPHEEQKGFSLGPYRVWTGDLDLALTRLRTLESGAGRDATWEAFPEHSTIRRVDRS